MQFYVLGEKVPLLQLTHFWMTLSSIFCVAIQNSALWQQALSFVLCMHCVRPSITIVQSASLRTLETNKINKVCFFVQSVTYATLLNFKDKHKQELSLFVRSIPPFQAFTGKKDMAHLQQ